MTVVAQANHFASASYFDRKSMKRLYMCGYINRFWNVHDCFSCIVLHLLQVGCHIMNRIKEQ